jgi:hypothetical protein
MMGHGASRPSGCVTQVLTDGAERQAAYNFIEHNAVASGLVIDAMVVAAFGNVQGWIG